MAKIDQLLEKMVSNGASDLHLSSQERPFFRIDGTMQHLEGSPEVTPNAVTNLLKEIAPGDGWKEFENSGDLDFAYEIDGVGRFRANYFQDRKGPGAVFRQIPTEIPTAEQLGISEGILNLCNLTKGLVVVTGPTGSGKSTTLAAMVNHINENRGDHIITIEDPIEFTHPNKKCLVNQREVGRHTGSFSKALRAALREDPDIVLVGEMRDLETVKIAIETAETGHLVFGTLHTTTAASTVDRIIDQFPPEQQSQIRVMLAESLKGVVAQTLCKKNPKGRVAAHEILIVNSGISSIIREGKTHQIGSMMQMGGKYGMRLMNDALIDLVQQGLVDPEEAYRKCTQKDDMQKRLEKIGHSIEGKADPSGSSPQPEPPAALPSTPKEESAEPVAAQKEKGPSKLDPFEEFKKKRGL